MGVLQRFWTKHRLATVLCFALLFLGLLLQPWSLVLVLAVSFGGPLLKRLERFKASPINSWRRNHWIGVALGLSVVLLAITGGNSGRGALILALLPVAWVLVTDRSLLQDRKQIEHGSNADPLALSATDAEVENNTEPPEPLVGAELLAKVKELGDVGKSDLVRACGYFSIKEDGGERLNFTGFYEALLGAKGVGLDSASGSNDDEGEDEEKSIYIKTEPGGHVLFGKLSEEQVDELRICIDNQELSEELSEIGDNSYGQLTECDGVVNSGDEGDFGNEGTITYSTDQPALGPEVDDEGAYADGVYVVVMKLSKCSIEFEFNAEGGFDEDEFEEISVPVRIPEEIEHGLYGHPDFNIITGFKFRGEDVEEYEGEVEDRGYDVQLTFFAIKDGETHNLYSNYNGEEDWHNREVSIDLLENQPISFNRSSGTEPDFLRSTNISYVTIEIEDPNELNAELIDNLHKKFEEEAVDAPFCNDGDYDIDDLKNDLPEGWSISKMPSKKSGALIILAEINYNASRDIDFDAFEYCDLEYCRLCGCYPIFSCNSESDKDPFGGDFVTHDSEKTLMIQTYDADGEYDEDEVQAEDFADRLEDWRQMIADAKKQGEEDWQDPEISKHIPANNRSDSSTSEDNSGTTNRAVNTENQKPNPLGIRNGTGPFATEITKSKINKPDSDGDVSIDIELKVTSFSDEDVELVLTKMVVLTANGLPLIETEDEWDLLINNASTEELDLNSGYFKAAQIAGSSASETQVLLQVVPCGCKYTELPLLELTSPGNITGLSEKVELNRDVQLQGFSVVTTKPDEEGNCQLEVKGLIVNESECLLNKVVMKIRLLDRNGREIDSTEWSEKVPPSGTICVDTSMWSIKSSRLDGAKAKISTKIFSSHGSHELSWSVGSKPVPIEADMSQVGNVKNNTIEEFNANFAVADRASELPLKEIQSESCSEFDLEIESAKYRAPDSDDETSYEIEYNIKNMSNKAIELLLTRLFILHKSGLIVAVSENESEDMAENGESISSSISSWGASVNELDGDPDDVQLMLQATACSCLFRDLGSIDCPRGGKTEALIPITEGDTQLSVEAISIATDPSDDGECGINIKALVKNNTTQSFPRVVLSTRLINASGREIEDTYTQEEIAPYSQIVIEDSLWGIKENRLNSAKLQFSLKAFAATGSCTFITKELSLED